AIAAGGYQTCALAAERVLCWGDFQGYGSAVAEPQQLESFGGTWEGLAAGSNHVCARDGAAGQMGCWGRSDYGEVGGWSGGALVHTYIEGIDGIFAGGDLTCATASRGSASDVFCFGSGVPMGLGTFGGSVMGPVMFLRDVTAFAASDGHACALTGGRVRCAGTNDFGQTGDGTFDYHTGFDVDVLGLR
ncbi:MAG: hypothetical protein IT379_19830, partial [Deltaproteobacteria bacterium]|nr:hypothetical protein [Deltaproteobacteria bacterium]